MSVLLAAGALHHVNFLEIVRHPWFISSISAFWGAQMIKVAWTWFKEGRLRLGLLKESGGMPSAHSSLVSALACAVGITEGFDAPNAMIAAGVAIIVLVDAANFRREAGEHARLLNAIIAHMNERLPEGERIEAPELKEKLGHRRREVLVGVLFGMAMAFMVCAIWDFWK